MRKSQKILPPAEAAQKGERRIGGGGGAGERKEEVRFAWCEPETRHCLAGRQEGGENRMSLRQPQK